MGTINQEDIIILNTYAPNPHTSHFFKSILLDFKIQINPKSVTVGDFSTLLPPTYWSSGQETNRET